MQEAHVTDKSLVEKNGPRDERDLEVTYGKPVPQPRMTKGSFDAIGELAGSTNTAPSVEGLRTTTFSDSLSENGHLRKN